MTTSRLHTTAPTPRRARRLLTVPNAGPWTRAILANARHMLVAAIDCDGTLMAFNRQYQSVLHRLYGLDIEPGCNLLELLGQLPARHQVVLDLWRRALDGAEFRGIRTVGDGDREELVFEGSLVCIYDGDGEQIGAALIARDIGPLLRTQRALDRLNVELEQRIRSRTAALERSHARLRDADERKNRFLAMLGHELRNPLGAILNGLELWRRTPPDDVHQLDRIRELVTRQARQLERLVDDLLDISRITRGKLQLQRARIDLRDPVRSAVAAVDALIEARDHTFDVDLPDEPVELVGDHARIEQVIVNLLTNAARYTDPGGHIWLGLSVCGDRAAIEVRDTGIGISDEARETIFGEFVQVENHASQRGLGLGLSLVRRLTAAHHGEVEVESPGPGQGSTFRILLPLGDGAERDLEAGAAANDDQERDTAPDPLRVLVVDPHDDHAEALAALLADQGHVVRVASSAYEALQVSLTLLPDLVLLELALPDVDGRTLCRRFRHNPDLASTFLVALSGFGQPTDVRRSIEAGCDAHLVKPIELEHLQAIVDQVAAEREPPPEHADGGHGAWRAHRDDEQPLDSASG